MHPFFIERDRAQLFGSYHPPAGNQCRTSGVVLCYPVGQEYIRAHRSFLQLAQKLSGKGLASLRFEYVGCGDSSGDQADWTLPEWLEDIQAATRELRRLSGVSSVYLIGLRLGASLALLAAPHCPGLAGLVLWEPIVRGRDFIRELEREHAQWLNGSFAEPAPGRSEQTEFLGFAFPPRILREIESIDLECVQLATPCRVLLVSNRDSESSDVMRQTLAAFDTSVTQCHVDEPAFWQKHEDDDEKGLVPIRSLSTVISWLDETIPRYLPDPSGRSAPPNLTAALPSSETPNEGLPSDIV